MISLLSYYDTILNDNIISENYNFHKENITSLNDTLYNSPGVTNEKFENIESTMIENGYVNPTYSDYIDYSYDYNFQSFLIKESNSIISKTPDSGELYSRSLGLWDYKVLLEHLYPNIEISTFEDYVHQNLNENLDDPVIQQRFINEIKQSVDDNIPIIVHIKGYDGIDDLHHAVVVYDYDDKYIYANFGYGPGYTHLPIFEYDALGNIISDYNRIYYITQCDFSNFSHVHSDNYVINGVKYCGCGYHEHELAYSSINCFEHIGECPCGYYETGIHIHTNGHNPNCRYCNESYLIYTPTSSQDISGIIGMNFGIMAGRYRGDNQNTNIFLNISYKWESIPTERFIDYIVVYWTYGLNIDDEISITNYYGSTLKEYFENYVGIHNYGSRFQEIYWTFDLTKDSIDVPTGEALIEFQKIDNRPVTINIRYYHISYTAAAIQGISIDSSYRYTTGAIHVSEHTYIYDFTQEVMY